MKHFFCLLIGLVFCVSFASAQPIDPATDFVIKEVSLEELSDSYQGAYTILTKREYRKLRKSPGFQERETGTEYHTCKLTAGEDVREYMVMSSEDFTVKGTYSITFSYWGLEEVLVVPKTVQLKPGETLIFRSGAATNYGFEESQWLVEVR